MEEKLPKISVITPCYKDADTLAKHIDTFIEQDYSEKELILIDDGSKDGTKEIIQKYEKKYPKIIKGLYFKENKGACIARNEGAKIATGEIFSFLPADSFIKPGVLRYWVETMAAHKEFGFLYGGYAFVDTPIPTWEGGQLNQNYLSQPFSARDLETGNYIDGSFPLWAEVYWDATKKVGLKDGLWNPEVKSLQDWDFWLSVVKDLGAKGAYSPSVFFETTIPHAGGLSYDSDRNWVARTKQIKSLHKIPERGICVTSPAAPFHGRSVAHILDADYKDSPAFKAHSYKAIYEIGFWANAFIESVSCFLKPEHFRKIGMMLKNNQVPELYGGAKLIHFIGSDILTLQKLSLEKLKEVRNFLRRCDGVFAELPATQKELANFGIKAEVVPFPPRKWYDVSPMPKKKAIAVYMPQTNEDFYFKKLFLGDGKLPGLAQKMKDIDFYFFGNESEKGHPHKNIYMMGRTDGVGELIEKTNAIVRIVPHDGLPMSVAEWMGAGRNAITTIEMKHATHFDLLKFVAKYGKSFTVPQLEKELEAEIRKVVELPLNEVGAKYIRKLLDKDKYIKKINSYLEYDEKLYWERRGQYWAEDVAEYPTHLEKVEPLIKKISPKSVIDIGCGDGRWSEYFKDITYLGVDISSTMIDAAKKKYPKAKFIVSSIEELGKKVTKKHDLIFIFTTLLHVKPENMDEAIKSLKKIGKEMILIEPHDAETKAYCFRHDYEKLFNVISKKKVDPFRTMYHVKL